FTKRAGVSGVESRRAFRHASVTGERNGACDGDRRRRTVDRYPDVVSLNAALAAGATLIAVAFSLSTLDRYLRRRRPHELAWTISLWLFAIGGLALWWAEAHGWGTP